MSRNLFPMLFEDQGLRRLLERLISGSLDVLRPLPDPNVPIGYRYPDVEAILGRKPMDAIAALEDLFGQDILVREFSDTLFRCPNCSHALAIRYHCIKCDSFMLSKHTVAMCEKCGYHDVVENFQAGDEELFCPGCGRELLQPDVDYRVALGVLSLSPSLVCLQCGETGPKRRFIPANRLLVCPKCRTELVKLGEDYSLPSQMYKCHSCGELKGNIIRRFHCAQCGVVADPAQVTMDHVWAYRLNPKKQNDILLALAPKQQILDDLVRRGFTPAPIITAEQDAAGVSGARHPYTICVQNDKGLRVLLEFFGGLERDPMEFLYSAFTRALDLGAHVLLVMAFAPLPPNPRRFAQYHRIALVEESNIAKAVGEFRGRFDALLQNRLRRGPDEK